MARARRREYAPEAQDVHNLVCAAREELELVLKFEYRFTINGGECLCRAYRPGALRRADCVCEVAKQFYTGSGMNETGAAYHAGLKLYTEETNKRSNVTRLQEQAS